MYTWYTSNDNVNAKNLAEQPNFKTSGNRRVTTKRREREAERGKVVKVRTERATLRLLILIVATFPLSTRSIHVLPSPKYSMKKQLTSEPESPHPSVRQFKDRLPLMYVHKRSVYFRTGLVYTEVANRFRWPEVVFVQRFKNWTTTHRRWYSSGTRSQMW